MLNLIEYFLINNFSIRVLCLKNPFENKKADPRIEIIEFQNNVEKIKYLKTLTGALFFTTTPSVGTTIFPKSQVKPSNKIPKYIYLFHSLVSPNEMYIKKSFKNFDYIFSPSKTISNQIKCLISSNTKIYETGYLLLNEVEIFKFNNENNNKVLLAPTWGVGVNEISKDINKINQFAIKNKLELVFRPHPMTDVESLKLNSEIIIDSSKDLSNLEKYSLLITDFSGIALEFFYLTGKPIIFLDVAKKIKRKMSKKEKDFNLIENMMREMLGKKLNINQLENFDIKILNPHIDSKNFIKSLNFEKNSLNETIRIVNHILLGKLV